MSQSTTDSQSTQDKPLSLNKLATLTVPPGFDQVLINIQSSLNAAQHLIDQSMAKSGALVQASLETIYPPKKEPTSQDTKVNKEAKDGEFIGADQPLQTDGNKDSQAFEQQITEQKLAAQQVAEAAEEAMTAAMATMELNLKTQQQAYQTAVMHQHELSNPRVAQGDSAPEQSADITTPDKA